MQNIFTADLQFFAEGGASAAAGSGAGGTGTGTGSASGAESSADAGQKWGESLNIPPQMRDRYRKKQPADKAASSDDGSGELPSFAQLLKKPEYNRAMQEIVSKRLKGAKQAGDTLERLTPALKVLAQRYGMEYGEGFDAEAFCNAVSAETNGGENSGSADSGGFAPEQQPQSDNRAVYLAHFSDLRREAEELKTMYPGFDLMREINENPVFARVTAPDIGMSVADAFYATHRQELERSTVQAVVRKTSEALANSIRAGATRPAENGGAITAAAPSAVPYSRMTGTERDQLRREVYTAGQRGRKLPLRG